MKNIQSWSFSYFNLNGSSILFSSVCLSVCVHPFSKPNQYHNLMKCTIQQASEETLSNIRTVVSLGQEEEFFEKFRKELSTSHRYRIYWRAFKRQQMSKTNWHISVLFRQAKKRSHFAGLVTGSFFGIINLSFAAAFRYGGYLVTKDDVTIKEMMT